MTYFESTVAMRKHPNFNRAIALLDFVENRHKAGDSPVRIDSLSVMQTGFAYYLAHFFSLNGWLITQVDHPGGTLFEFRPNLRPLTILDIKLNESSTEFLGKEDLILPSCVRLISTRFLTKEEIEYGLRLDPLAKQCLGKE